MVTTKLRENFLIYFLSCGSRNSRKTPLATELGRNCRKCAFASTCDCRNSKKTEKIKRIAAAATRGKSEKLEKSFRLAAAATRKNVGKTCFRFVVMAKKD